MPRWASCGERAPPGCTASFPIKSSFSFPVPSSLVPVTGKLSVFLPYQFLPTQDPHWRVTLGTPITQGRRSELTFDLIFLSCRLTLDLSFFKKSGLLFDFIISRKRQKKRRQLGAHWGSSALPARTSAPMSPTQAALPGGRGELSGVSVPLCRVQHVVFPTQNARRLLKPISFPSMGWERGDVTGGQLQ